MIKYFDIGLNLFCKQFKQPEEIINRAADNGVSCILTGSDMHSSEKVSNFVIHPQSSNAGNLLDCAGQPIAEGCKVAFMEYPSQGFSGSLVVGEVLRIGEDGLTIRVESSAVHKHLRKPGEVVVIEQSQTNTF